MHSTAASTDPVRRAIAVFDSGVGGLTVLGALREAFPGTDFVYLGDTARVPYGTKSAGVVTRYALEAAWYLSQRPLAALVVACNTASAVAIPDLRRAHPDLPIFGVVEPGARAAVAASQRGGILVLGTEGTVASGAYPRAISALRQDAAVRVVACPLFVPLAEEGLVSGPIPELAASHYLDGVLDDSIDTVVLGCTHYPLLRDVIAARTGPHRRIVDSAAPLVEELRPRVDQTSPGQGDLTVLTTDHPTRFLRIGRRFLGSPVTEPTRIDLEALVAEERRRQGGSDAFLLGAAA
jgi:glutamate racemase